MENVTTTTTPFPPASNSTRNALKSILLIILFFGTFLAATASFLLRRFTQPQTQPGQQANPSVKRIFSFISCFGAGVFLATCLLDLLPDSMESIRRAEKHMGHEISFPLPTFCVALGFLLVLMLEQAILYAHRKQWITQNGLGRLLSHQEEAGGLITSTTTRQRHSHEPGQEEGEEEEAAATPQLGTDTHSTFRVLTLVFALSLHAVFEGLSIGMISDVAVLLQIFVALFIHKSVVGFSLGVRLVQSELRSPTIVICCAVFAGQVLIGGFIGLAIVDLLNGKASVFLVSGILQAIACGTFLYVTAFEILPHELNNGASIPLKMLFLLIGFALITGFIALFPESDSD